MIWNQTAWLFPFLVWFDGYRYVHVSYVICAYSTSKSTVCADYLGDTSKVCLSPCAMSLWQFHHCCSFWPPKQLGRDKIPKCTRELVGSSTSQSAACLEIQGWWWRLSMMVLHFKICRMRSLIIRYPMLLNYLTSPHVLALYSDMFFSCLPCHVMP